MAHFAKLDENNIVVEVIVVDNKMLTNENGEEVESIGVDFINNLYGTNDVWKQTSYNGNLRKNYAGKGFLYDENRDAFIEPTAPYPSWILNEETCQWEAPVPRPTDIIHYYWDEDVKNWVE